MIALFRRNSFVYARFNEGVLAVHLLRNGVLGIPAQLESLPVARRRQEWSVPDPENGKIRMVVKRRRTRRHRRNRFIRRALFLSVLALFTALGSGLVVRSLSPSFLGSLFHPQSEANRITSDQRALLDEILARVQPPRPVYPYSVVPGGIADAKELKWVAEHDPVVAAHYAGFDYDHARVVRLTLERTAFVSYRIGNHIYWMRRRITLHKGEKLITDGHMTARGRCANRVEEKPQQEAAANEPAPEKFDQPAPSGGGTAMASPGIPFQSSLLGPAQAGGSDPTAPMTSESPFGGGGLLAFSPPPLPEGVCGPAAQKGAPETSKGKKSSPCGSGGAPSPVPEPSTWILFISGLTVIAWQVRRRQVRT